MKKKILFVNEASFVSSGYGIYGKEILKRLHDSGKYEVAELACYGAKDDERFSGEWKYYHNLPNSDEENNIYNSSSTAQFGAWKFEDVCIDFKPDVVMDIRDYWMMAFESSSPARPYFNHIMMPTVDAYPQKQEWIDVYMTGDAILTYQDWSGFVLNKQTGNQIKWRGSASPAASEEYYPLSREDRMSIKESLGLGPNIKVLGTIMRNQRRKLYPTLFKHFRAFLDETGRNDVVLYCHVSYPDNGWDLPYYIQKYNLSSKVFLTYNCNECGNSFPSHFQDAVCHCIKCGQRAAGCASVQFATSEETLNKIINMFDLYVQYANSEGFGMPQCEAASCGVPIMSVDYSAMSDIVKKLDGYPIEVSELSPELETGCNRAIPSKESFINILKTFFSLPESMRDIKRMKTREAYLKHFSSWDKTAEKWMEVIDSLEGAEREWSALPRYHNPEVPNESVNTMNNNDFSYWLVKNVLGQPELCNTSFQARIIRDLNYGVTLGGMGGLYYNDHSHQFQRHQHQKFGREEAYNKMVHLCQLRNAFEQKRISSLSG